MKRFIIFFLLCLCAYTGWAQGIVKGKILDRQKSEPLGFVNIKVTEQGSDKFAGGGITDAGGNWRESFIELITECSQKY